MENKDTPAKPATEKQPDSDSVKPITEEEIARKTWDNFNWIRLGQRLYERKMAEMNTGLYDPRPYDLMEKAVFIIVALGVFFTWCVTIYLLSVMQYLEATGCLGISVLYTYFVATFYSRNKVSLKATTGSLEMKKEETR